MIHETRETRESWENRRVTVVDWGRSDSEADWNWHTARTLVDVRLLYLQWLNRVDSGSTPE